MSAEHATAYQTRSWEVGIYSDSTSLPTLYLRVVSKAQHWKRLTFPHMGSGNTVSEEWRKKARLSVGWTSQIAKWIFAAFFLIQYVFFTRT
jgi:hypothetical protein